ncbi:unnamed protein product [Bemisia tabaci]|uniref:RRP15-like protein n=1 Tax=Bemisia tabaci TaxID=7038 RepID=A0A9P0F5H1_BEMTA|nr:PREDICTED: RRP15-like protein [Bemisia tabaci]CAH0389797.1 unnamed protein product [Bemisia tabaci]
MAVQENSDTSMDCESVDQTDAWTEAINKVLQTNVPRKKSVVLALAEKDQEVKEETEIKKEYDFEIEGGTVSDEDIQEEKPDVKDLDLKLKLGTKRLLKKEYAKVGHVKPDILEKNYERTLMKIATKGVVQLFNAVKQQQKDIEKVVKSSRRKTVDPRDVAQSLDKERFFNKLSEKAKSVPVSAPDTIRIKEEEEEPSWSVLRDDFLVSSSAKTWDT